MLARFITDHMYSIVIPSIISCDSSSVEVGFNGILLGGGVVDKTGTGI